MTTPIFTTGLLESGDFTWTQPLPSWVTEIREHQHHALAEIINAYDQGAKLVVLSAPTGSGKTLIGELVRRVVGERGLYVCHGLALQDQFVKDFDAPVLKGRANYPTVYEPDMTADDCGGKGCYLCPSHASCGYQIAKGAAIHGNPAVLNTAYFLSEANGPGLITEDRGLIVMDEADTLEGELMRWAEFKVGPGAANALGMTIPRKGVHWPTILKWLEEYVARLKRKMTRLDPQGDAKELRKIRRRAEQVRRMFLRNRGDGEGGGGGGDEGTEWVRVYDRSDALILKPVMVDQLAREYLWPHGERWLLMSATVIGAEQMLGDLGYDGAWAEVDVPSTFPVEHRPVYPVPVATMTRKGKEEGEWERAVKGLNLVLDQHPDERVLVHTVSYELARLVMEGLDDRHRARVTSYSGADGRARALARYKAMGDGVLVAPSMDRGVDLPGDLCRVQVVMKLPQPYLGDQQINARLRSTETGELWYQLETIRTLIQMTGRGVRSADDWAATYVLDRQFMRKWDEWRRWLPDWWADAVVMDRRPSDLLPGLRDL